MGLEFKLGAMVGFWLSVNKVPANEATGFLDVTGFFAEYPSFLLFYFRSLHMQIQEIQKLLKVCHFLVVLHKICMDFRCRLRNDCSPATFYTSTQGYGI